MTRDTFKITSGNAGKVEHSCGYTVANSNADGYNDFLEAVKRNFNISVESGVKLFQTDAMNLFTTFLNALPNEARQHYTCRACGNFLNRYGNLVTIDEDGKVTSALWNEYSVPQFFHKAVRNMRKRVELGVVTNVFLSETPKLGNEITEGWHHLFVHLPKELVKSYSRVHTAEQAMTEKTEGFKMLKSALNEHDKQTVETALTLLRSESLYRSEKVLGVVEWFREVQKDVSRVRAISAKDNVVWKAVAVAPPGFTHIRSSMVGTLLNDITQGYDYETVSKRFADKMNPTKYQRPTAPPKYGNVKRGNELIEQLGLERSFDRRFARVEELETLWEPRKAKQRQLGGLFGHLVSDDDPFAPKKAGMKMPGERLITWEKFAEKVLPTADKIEFLTQQKGNYSAILTACHEDAPPVIQWDEPENRNPFNWYVYSNGSSCNTWGLLSNTYVEVTAVTLQPSNWYSPGKYSRHGESVFFILKGAKDKNNNGLNSGNGSAIFPEILNSDLHEIRSTIESFSNSKSIQGYDTASACGLRLQKGSMWNAKFRVTANGVTTLYTLDRWE